MQTTIKDVAKKTGLSTYTISKYLNGGRVKEKNRILIESAIKELNYQPNLSAVSLRRERSFTIGFLINNLQDETTAVLARELEIIFGEQNYSLIISVHKGEEAELRSALHFMEERQVDGIILQVKGIQIETDIPMLRQLSQKIPLILLDDVVGSAGKTEGSVDSIMFNTAEGIYRATEDLLQNGHNNIVLMRNEGESFENRMKDKGYERALEDYHLPAQNSQIVRCQNTIEAGRRELYNLLESGLCPTALILADENIAIGVLAELNTLHITVPDGLSIVSYLDSLAYRLYYPQITTVVYSYKKMAKEVCDLMMKRISGELNKNRIIKMIDPLLIKRESVKSLV